jgi:hydroxymethylpyrimidine/phosphomethylpyrimidine kinase
MPRVLVITPNLPEAAVLLGIDEAADETSMRHQADRLIALGANAVLMKGGHASGPESADLLVTATSFIRLPGERIATRNTHGTGCTLSAAIAAGLARGLDLTDAVRDAKVYTTGAIAAADRLSVGTGSGPLHHFYRWW